MDFPLNSSTYLTAKSATPNTNNQEDTGTDCFQWVSLVLFPNSDSSNNKPLETTL